MRPKAVLRAALYRCNISSDRIYWTKQHCTRSIFSTDETQTTYSRRALLIPPLLYSATPYTPVRCHPLVLVLAYHRNCWTFKDVHLLCCILSIPLSHTDIEMPCINIYFSCEIVVEQSVMHIRLRPTTDSCQKRTAWIQPQNWDSWTRLLNYNSNQVNHTGREEPKFQSRSLYTYHGDIIQ